MLIFLHRIPPLPSSPSALNLTLSVSVAHTYPLGRCNPPPAASTTHTHTHIPTLAPCLCHSVHLVSLLWPPQRSSAGPQDVKGRAKPVGAAASCRGASESDPFFERRLEECDGAAENSEPLTSTVTHPATQTLEPVMALPPPGDAKRPSSGSAVAPVCASTGHREAKR